MNKFVDITNRKELQRLLLTLDAEAIPLWGKMKPQQMVEHLVEEVKWTNGKKNFIYGTFGVEADNLKQKMVYTDAELPKNIFLEELPLHYTYSGIPAAVNQLMTELDDFDVYFKAPGITSVHGGIGPLNYNEWIIYHGKHFTHHLKQFNLFPGHSK